MEKFSLDKYLENPSRKIVTRDGRVVKILDTEFESGNGNKSILAKCIYNNKAAVYVYTTDGKANNIGETENDLLFADEEEELTEFEKKLQIIISDAVHWTSDDGSICYFGDKEIKKISGQLFDLVRKEIEKENSEFKPKFTYNEKDYSKLANKLIEFRNNTPLCSVSYRDGEGRNVILHYEKEMFELVKNEILKDLPKWKKITEEKQNYLAYGYLSHDEYYLSIQELKDKLPKE
jgi:hypothetical protein